MALPKPGQTVDAAGMGYLTSLPRKVVTIYMPLVVFLIVLLFPFYWMTITAFKPNEELLSHEGNPFWVHAPTLDHFKKLLFDTAYPEWLWNTVLVTVVSTFISLVCSVLAATPSSACVSRDRAASAWRSSSLTWCRRPSSSSLWQR